MSGDFFLKICNQTANDITELIVMSIPAYVTRLNPFNFDRLRAGDSAEYKLINRINPMVRLAKMTAAVATLGYEIPFDVESDLGDYGLGVRVVFRNDRRDAFYIFLDHTRNSYQRTENILQTHEMNVEGAKGDDRIVVTFENTAQQLENRQAGVPSEEDKGLMSDEFFHEAATKFENDASEKSTREIS